MRAKFMEITFLTKLEKTNVNASGTEGNITVLKKTEEIDGTQRVYISGASLKYALKTYWEENGLSLSPMKRKTKMAQITTECNPEKYIDDDLLGYLDTESNNKRVAPVKTNGMISIFPYKGDLDRGVRFDPEGMQHSMFDLEIVTNVFRSNWAVELDRIGEYEVIVSKDKKTKKEVREKKRIPTEEKEKRVKALLKGLFNLWSRVKQTNYLTKMNPEVIVLAFRDDKSLTIADKLRVNRDYELDIEAFKEAIDYHKDSLKKVYLAGFKSFVKNWDAVVKELDGYQNIVKVMDITDLKNMVLSDDFKFYE